MGELLTDLVKDIRRRRLFMLVYSGQCNTVADAIAKDAFIDALWDKELTIRAMEREPKFLEKAFKIAERMELYARKVKPEGKDGFESIDIYTIDETSIRLVLDRQRGRIALWLSGNQVNRITFA